jgi:hypothetical protein
VLRRLLGAGRLPGLHARPVGGPSQSCWLLPKFALKPSDPEAGADNCTSGAMAAPPNPGRLAYTARGPAGIWVQHGDTNASLNQSFVLGGDTAVVWRDVEVADDVWDWAATDNAFARQAAAGFFIETALMVGDAAPLWLYDRKEDGGGGVTPVNVTPAAGHTQQPIIFPSYLEQGYQQYFLRAVDRFAEHIASLPKSIRSKKDHREPGNVRLAPPATTARGTDSQSTRRKISARAARTQGQSSRARGWAATRTSGTTLRCQRRRPSAPRTPSERSRCCGTPTSVGWTS